MKMCYEQELKYTRLEVTCIISHACIVCALFVPVQELNKGEGGKRRVKDETCYEKEPHS